MTRPAPTEDYRVTVRIAAHPAERLREVRLDRGALDNGRCDAAFLARLGTRLFALAFPTRDAVEGLAVALAGAVRGRATLRLVLHTPEPEAATLPWEYLRLPHDAAALCGEEGLAVAEEDRFLALHPAVSLVRQAGDLAEGGELERVGRLRVLVAWAEPAGWAPIAGLGAEAANVVRILTELPRSHVEVETLAHATPASLRDRVLAFRPHVLHYAGHGAFPGAIDDPGDGVSAASLVLEAPDGAAPHAYLPAPELRSVCAAAGVQVVVLNSCWGARATLRIAGLAQSLTAPGGPGRPAPVVVAHQKPVRQSAAPAFAWALYKKLAFGAPLEDGVRAFRRECVADDPAGAGSPDWGNPVVFLGVGKTHLFRTERVDLYPVNFRPLISDHVPIVGRKFLKDAIRQYRETRAGGAILLTAPPGLGKTAFVSQLVEDDPTAVHFFYRGGSQNDPDECVRSLYQGLLGRYGVVEENPTGDDVERRTRLADRLRRVSEECAARGRTELILIDSLDEAGTTRQAKDNKNALEVLPERLPAGVYLLFTSRPGPMAEACVGRYRRSLLELSIDPESKDNHDDAAAFCVRELRGRVADADESALARLGDLLARKAAGNFLVLKLFLWRDALRGRVAAADVEREADDLSGEVDNEYRVFFDRVTGDIRNNRDEMKLLNRVLGAFVTARAAVTAEQVCAAFGVEPEDWEWARMRVRQFLTAAPLRQRERGTEAFAIYHETFRAFLGERLRPRLAEFHGHWADHAERWRDLDGYDRAYALRHLVSHLLAVATGA